MEFDCDTGTVKYLRVNLGSGLERIWFAVKYLTVDGKRVRDPNVGGSSGQTPYRKLSPHGQVDQTSQFENEGNYLLVPAQFNFANVSHEVSEVDATIAAGGLKAGLLKMKRGYSPGGKENLQKWAVSGTETDAAAKIRNLLVVGICYAKNGSSKLPSCWGCRNLNLWGCH